MHHSIDDIEKFYNSDIGGIVQNILCTKIRGLWPDLHGYRVMGCGYAMPYLSVLDKRTDRSFAMMLGRQGATHWPRGCKNMTFLCDEDRIPIENASLDRVLMVHYLEYCNDLRLSLREIWRVLKPNGRVIIVVPNRMGMWARADWAPLGHGRPFTQVQLDTVLRDNLFVPETHKGALFFPPLPGSPVMMKSANLIERMGRNFFPFIAGVHIMEASKQIYARADKPGSGSAVFEKTKGILAGNGRPVPQSYVSEKN